MNTTVHSRETILARIHSVTEGIECTPYADLPQAYCQRGTNGRSDVLKLLVERLNEYGADVLECLPGDLIGAITTQIQRSGRRVFVVPPGLPPDWLVRSGAFWKIDRDLPNDEIEECDGVVTAASSAIADSGTIVLHHGPTEGRRVISLLPDWHLCILYASQVVETLPEYFARCQELPRLATYISGPSATADIEMTRIKGVHGPRFLNVILVDDAEPPAARDPETRD